MPRSPASAVPPTAARPRPRTPAVPDQPLVVVTGKGGVGKTTIAAVLATLGARGGRPTVLAQTGGATDARHLLGPFVTHRSLDASTALRAYVREHGPPGAGLVLGGPVFHALTAAAPGLAELLVVGQAWELARPSGPGVPAATQVVLDAPATGHALALLQAPAAYAGAVRSGPVQAQARAIDAFLRDDRRTAVVAVTAAEQLAVSETLMLHDALRETLGLRLQLVVVNGVLPDRFSTAQARVVRRHPPSRWRAAVLHAAARAQHQRVQLARLRAALEDVPVFELPLLTPPPSGPAGLASLVAAWDERVAGRRPATVAAAV